MTEIEESVDKEWDEYKNIISKSIIVINKFVDSKTKRAYDEYKRAVMKYTDGLNELQDFYTLIKNDPRMQYTGRSKLPSPLREEEREMLNRLGKLRSEVNAVEKFIREINPTSNMPFVDLDYLKKKWKKGNKLTWMSSDKYLSYAKPMVTDEYLDPDYEEDPFTDIRQDAQSVGYSKDRQRTGRVMTPELWYNPESDNIESHEGRHRSLANRLLQGEKAQQPVVLRRMGEREIDRVPGIKRTVPERQTYAAPQNIKRLNEAFRGAMSVLAEDERERDVNDIRQYGDYGEHGYPKTMSPKHRRRAEMLSARPHIHPEAIEEAMNSDMFKAMNKAWEEFKKSNS